MQKLENSGISANQRHGRCTNCAIDKQVRGRFSLESLDVGVDALTPVDKAYGDKQPYRFTGTINTVRFDFGESVELTAEERFEMFLKMD